MYVYNTPSTNSRFSKHRKARQGAPKRCNDSKESFEAMRYDPILSQGGMKVRPRRHLRQRSWDIMGIYWDAYVYNYNIYIYTYIYIYVYIYTHYKSYYISY